MVSMRRSSIAAFLVALTLALALVPAFAEQWYFYVENKTDSKMTGLYASEDGQTWGRFDLGSGVAPGQRVKMIWSKATNDQSCNQYLKATFADGTSIKSEKTDFCTDLDDAIVFSG